MAFNHTTIGDVNTLVQYLRRENYAEMFGANWSLFLKPFQTHTLSSGAVSYREPVLHPNQTGLLANSSGLNPFGQFTEYEGIIHGTGVPTGTEYDVNINPTGVRTYGFKTPMTVVGWGFDIFGYPAPNFASGWEISGSFGNIIPSSVFEDATGLISEGSNVPDPYWRAGPVDLRWDINRKVWTSPQSVYAARVKRARVTGAEVNSTEPQYPSGLRYDVELYDFAYPVELTGLQHVGPKPVNSTYKVSPLSSGDPCFLIHHPNANTNVPELAIWLVEPAAAEECGTTDEQGFISRVASGNPDYGGASDGAPWDSSGNLIGSGLFDGLETYNILISYGGTALNSIASGQFLMGNTSGTYSKFRMTAGSGIELTQDWTSNPSGTLTIALASGVQFLTSSGVNTSITELQGLTTPLSIEQGGTAATGKVWVDLTTNQSISGIKLFANGIQVEGTGGYLNPDIDFSLSSGIGIIFDTGNESLRISQTGFHFTSFSVTGHIIHRDALCYNNVGTTGIDIPLTIKQAARNLSASGQDHTILSQWLHWASGDRLVHIDQTGQIFAHSLISSGNVLTFGDITAGTNSINLVCSPTGAQKDILIPNNSGHIPVYEPSAASGDLLKYDGSVWQAYTPKGTRHTISFNREADATSNANMSVGSSLLTNTRGVPMPYDGSVIFHSMCLDMTVATSGTVAVEVRVNNVEVTQATITIPHTSGIGDFMLYTTIPAGTGSFVAGDRLHARLTIDGTMTCRRIISVVGIEFEE